MKCSKCGFDIVDNAKFCGNCGNNFNDVQQVTQSTNLNIQNNKNKKLFIILGIVAAVILLIVIIFIVINQKNKFKDPFEDVDNLTSSNYIKSTREYEENNSFVKKIEEDYKNGSISKDKYIMQLAYSIYDTDKLDSKYKTYDMNFNNPRQLFEKAFAMSDELSNETLKYIFEKYTLSDVVWDVEDDTTIEGTTNNKLYDYKVMPLVSENNDLSKLSNVILSNNKNFLIYYTTKGTNAITKEEAEKIASYLEKAVEGYKDKFGLEFKYETKNDFISSISTTKRKASMVLAKEGIDKKYLDTAMPVFIIDTSLESSDLLGYYVPPIENHEKIILKLYDVFYDNGMKIDNMTTTYSFPFFVVSSNLDNLDDTNIVSAHELFHHYQKYICGNGSYGDCNSGLFTVETTANFAASSVVNINKLGTALNSHAFTYISEIDSSIDKIDSGSGYSGYVFAHNYANIVSNGAKHLFDSMKTTDTLKYLYDNSGGKYKDVLLTTAEKNLTLDYSNKLLIAGKVDEIFYPENHKDIGIDDNNQTVNINYSSMNYYYINPQDYDTEAQLSFKGNSNDLSLLLFVKENNSYKYLYTDSLNKEFVINIDDFSNYQEIAIAIVNSEISGTLSYSYELENNGTKIPTVTAQSLNITTLEEIVNNYSSFVCYEIDEDEEYKTITQVKISFDKKEKINDMYFKGTIQLKNYDPKNPAFEITQKIVSGLLYIMQETYEEQFKNFKVITEEGKDKYSVTFKITKNYYEALNNNMSLNGEDKYSIIRTIKSEGFNCKYEK